MQQNKINAATAVGNRIGDVVEPTSIPKKPTFQVRDGFDVAFRRSRQMVFLLRINRARLPRKMGLASALEAIARSGSACGLGCLGDYSHFAVRVALQAMCLVAAVAEPVKLRALADRVCGEFKQFSVAEVAELGRAMRIVTFRNHGQSCAMLIA